VTAQPGAAPTGWQLAGVGIDAVEIARLRQAVERTPTLVDRLFTAGEQADCSTHDGDWKWWKLAARFAAKEAVAKAFGTGVDGFWFTDVEVVNNSAGRPDVVLSGGAVQVARERGVGRIHLSLSHTEDLAFAQAVAERVVDHPA
jgi:holo-[acyl-carrier protein] synthase